MPLQYYKTSHWYSQERNKKKCYVAEKPHHFATKNINILNIKRVSGELLQQQECQLDF